MASHDAGMRAQSPDYWLFPPCLPQHRLSKAGTDDWGPCRHIWSTIMQSIRIRDYIYRMTNTLRTRKGVQSRGVICDRSTELFLRVEFRNLFVRLFEENVLCLGKLYTKYHRRVLRFLVVLFIYLFSIQPAIHVTEQV
jgi:hypothetical protein